MPFRIDSIDLKNPRPSGQDFVVVYSVLNDGPDAAPHEDVIQMWGSDGSQPVNMRNPIPDIDAGHIYFTNFDVPALSPGVYDLSITFPDGSGTGDTIVVQ